MNTEIQKLNNFSNNKLFIKREDFFPFSFGGNKARKAQLFFEEIDNAGIYDCVVTYGSSSSNLCRVVSNMAKSRNMQCIIISPEEKSNVTYNSILVKNFGAVVKTVSVAKVAETIDSTLDCLKKEGKNPYFIMGGGHGDIGVRAYIDCYNEIRQYEKENNIYFDYIFHATGTGTTQAGLICGQLMSRDNRKIIGISIARRKPYGRNVVIESIKSYFKNNGTEVCDEDIEKACLFCDEYIGDGYGHANENILETIDKVMGQYGIPLDSTYTGKAFYGMEEYLKSNSIKDKKVLFIHTGGTPLFFDNLKIKG